MTVGLSQKAIVNLRCTAYVHARAAQLHSMHRRRCVGVMRQQSWVVAHNIYNMPGPARQARGVLAVEVPNIRKRRRVAGRGPHSRAAQSMASASKASSSAAMHSMSVGASAVGACSTSWCSLARRCSRTRTPF